MKSVSVPSSSSIDGKHLGLGILLTVVGAVCWGFSGTCAQLLFSDYALSPQLLVCVRTTVAGTFFLLLALVRDRARLKKAVLNPRSMGSMAVFGIFGIFACQTCYLFAIDASNAGTATVLQSLNLLVILAVTCIKLHRRPTAKECVGVGLAVVGTFLIATHGSLTGLAIGPEGLGWGLATAVATALYTMLPVKLLYEYGSVVTTGLGMALSGVVACVLFRPWEFAVSLDARGWLFLAAIVVIGTIVSFLCFLNGVKLVGSMLAGLLGCAEPVTACILSALWLGTVFMPVDIAGIAMIILMMWLMT